MFNFIIVVLTLIILQLFVFKFPIRKFIKNQINKMTGKIELLELKNTRFYDETKLLKEKADKQIEEVIQFLQNKAQTINKYSLANNTTESLLAYNEQFIKQIKIHY